MEKISALVRGFWRDHFRTAAPLVELLVVILFLAFIFGPDPSREYYPWPYLLLSFNLLAIVLSAVCTSLVTWRNSDDKMLLLVLTAGKQNYYLSLLLTALLLSLFWTVIALIVVLGVAPLSGSMKIANWGAMTGNLLIVAALFLVFSPLTGRSVEIAYAIILAGIGLGYTWSGLPGKVIGYLLPPLQANVKVAFGSAWPVCRDLIYFGILLFIGLYRFMRREFS